jgi:hypothetical protein
MERKKDLLVIMPILSSGLMRLTLKMGRSN